jgi:hypothetical protein
MLMEDWVIQVALCRNESLKNDYFNDNNIVSVSKDYFIEIVKLCKLLDFINLLASEFYI